MPDVFSPQKRSEIMARVRGRENKATELRLVTLLRRASISGWRRREALYGKPDFTFRKRRIVIFVDGCFWHSCPKHGSQPATNSDFWKAKLRRNIERDELVNKTLRESGWKVLRIWQHELTRKNEIRLLKRLEILLEDS